MHDEAILSLQILNVLAVVKTDIKQGVAAENKSRKTSAFAYKTAGKTVYEHKGSLIVSDPSHIVFLPKGQIIHIVLRNPENAYSSSLSSQKIRRFPQ